MFNVAEIAEHMVYAVRSAPVRHYPFPHMIVENVLPTMFYENILIASEQAVYHKLHDLGRVPKGMYEERYVVPADNMDGKIAMLRDAFCHALVCNSIFDMLCADARDIPTAYDNDTLLVIDAPGYKIGPHTDSPKRYCSALLYLAENDEREHLGTRLYMPKDRDRRCPGGPHHKIEEFYDIGGAPYRPNTMIAFWKTNNSFHGVPVTDKPRRLFLWDARRIEA